MTEFDRFHRRTEALEKQLQAKLGVRGKNLSKRLARAGRLLPRHVQKSGRVIADMQSVSGNPKLARLHDPAAVERAFKDITTHLDTIDPAERRKGMILGVMGGLVFNLLVLVGAIVLLLRWQDVI